MGIEIDGEWPGTWADDELRPRVPGRQTLVEVEARRWANWAGDASATMARNSSGSAPRKVDEEMARREPSSASEVAQVMAKLRAWGPGGSDVYPAAVGAALARRHPVPATYPSDPSGQMVAPEVAHAPQQGRQHEAGSGDRAVINDAARAGHLAACLARLLAPERAGEFADVALLLSAVEPPIARAALSLLRHMPGGAPTQSALEALNDVTAGQASRLLANPPARDVTPAHLRPMHDAGAVALPRRSFARSGGPSFVSRDLAVDLPARDVSDIGDVEPELVDQGDGGEPLSPAIAARMRELLHHDFTHVRLHTDAAAARAAAALGARAFTLGNHIYFNREQFTPDTPLGERLLIHELTHVVQYDEGRLPHADGGFKISDPGSATEREARAAEDSAGRLSPKEPLREPVPVPPARTTATGPAVAEIQRAPHDPPQTPAARVAFVREAGLNLRAGPDQKAASVMKMKFGQRVYVLEDSGTGEWLKIAVLGQTGYVYKPRIHFPSTDLIEKDPGLTLVKVKPGQTFWGLVKETYGIQGNESSRDQNINHFINAIRAVNKPEAFKVKTGILDDIGNAVVSGRDASDTELIAGVDLWIPSFGVAAKMDVGSGTVTGEVVRYAKKFQQKIDDFGAACRASGKYILPAIGRNAGELAMGMLQGLVDFALDAAKILAGSTAAGALLGSFFGGVGAVPGAEIGFEIGLLILQYYGLYMLAEAVLGVAGKLLWQLGQFIALAWEANGDKVKIEKAGEALAEALGIFVSALLVVVAAYLLKRGAKALSKTKFAQKVGETRLAKWFEERQKMTTTQDPLAKEKLEREKLEREKLEREKLEKEKLEKEKAEKEKAEREKLEKEKLEKEKAEGDFAQHEKDIANEAPGRTRDVWHNKLDLGSEQARIQAEGEAVYRDTFRKEYLKAREAGQPDGQAMQTARPAARKATQTHVRGEAMKLAQARARLDVARDANADGIPDAFKNTEPKAAADFAAFKSGARGATAEKLAPQLPGKTVAEMEALLQKAGGTRHPGAPGTFEPVVEGKNTYPQVSYTFPDGTLVRIKPLGDVRNGVDPMYSVEMMSSTPAAGPPQSSVAFKLDAKGNPVPKGRGDIANPYTPQQQLQHEAYEKELLRLGHLPAKK